MSGRWKPPARSQEIILAEPPWSGRFEQGRCCWCGERIELIEGAHHASRQRTRHRGDKWETGDRNCAGEYDRSRCWDARSVIRIRGDAECVDCGSTGAWDADHEIPLWKGGPHTAENIRRRCDACHKAKTRREAAERAALRRQQRGIPEQLPVEQLGFEDAA